MDRHQQELHAAMEERHWWFLARRRIVLELVRTLVPPDPKALVVDVGCGPGGNTGALAREYEAAGIDASADAIALARAAHPRARFWQGDLAQLPAGFDRGARLYLLMDVLEHVEDDDLFLSTVLSRCEPGTHVVITVPADPSLWSSHDEALGHHRRYEPESLRRLWQGLPVTELLLSFYNSRLLPGVRAARWLGRLLGRSLGPRGTDLRLPPAPLNRLLAAVFAGEARVLGDRLAGRRAQGYRAGASLIAVLRVDEAGIAPRSRQP